MAILIKILSVGGFCLFLMLVFISFIFIGEFFTKTYRAAYGFRFLENQMEYLSNRIKQLENFKQQIQDLD